MTVEIDNVTRKTCFLSLVVDAQQMAERYQELPTELNATMPEGLRIQAVSYGGHGLFATRPFKSGERIYVASCILVPDVKGEQAYTSPAFSTGL